MVCREVLTEDDQAVRSEQHGRGAQGRGHDVQVAKGNLADLWLGEGLERLGDGGCRRWVLAWGVVADPQLVAGLVETEGPGLVVQAGVAPSRGSVDEGGGEASGDRTQEHTSELQSL